MAKVKLFEESSKISKQFDEAIIKGDVARLKVLVQKVERDVETHDIFYRLHIYYSLATAVSAIGLFERGKGEPLSYEILQKQLCYYRKAIALFDEKQIKNETSTALITMKAVIYTNYGNALNECGRKIVAIEQYHQALAICPISGMPSGNLGMAYMNYAMLLSDNDGYIRDCLNHFAYIFLDLAIESKDPNLFEEARDTFKSAWSLFSLEYLDFLKKDIVLPELPKLTKAEKSYREWCVENALFLNPLSDIPYKALEFAFDGLLLPPILTSVESGVPIVIGMYNQLKQEYISARYLYYESLNCKSRPHFSDKRTNIAETLEYAQFSLRIEKLKSAFKTLYGILDKTAFFLNEYYDLGIELEDVTFKTIWLSTIKKKKKSYDLKNKLDDSKNLALRSLHWIQREFEDANVQYASPQFVRLKEVRNALEHRYTIITMFTKNLDELSQNNVATYISETELYDLTFNLLKLVREAIIGLTLSVIINEKEKVKKVSVDKIITMKVHQVDDEFKI